MKMGDRRLKQIDRYCTRAQIKPSLTGEPTNRAEKRKFKHVLKRERIKEDELDLDSLFAALRKHHQRP